MSQYEQGNKVASEVLQQGKAATEQTSRMIEQGMSITMDKLKEYHLKMIDITQTNAEAAFDFARKLATAKTPSEFMELWMTHAQKQFEKLSEQTTELTELGQRMARESAAPITRNANQALKRAS
jgi:phasin